MMKSIMRKFAGLLNHLCLHVDDLPEHLAGERAQFSIKKADPRIVLRTWVEKYVPAYVAHELVIQKCG